MKKMRKLKIGFEEHEDLLFKNFNTINKELNANSDSITEKRNLYLEISLARHVSSYGMLGVTFFPPDNFKNKLLIEVRSSKENIPFIDSVSNMYGCSFLGLEDIYAKSVLTSTLEYFSQSKIPTGKLVVNMAAYCDVRSSVWIFSCLTKIMLKILFGEYDKISDSQIENICDDCLK